MRGTELDYFRDVAPLRCDKGSILPTLEIDREHHAGPVRRVHMKCRTRNLMPQQAFGVRG
jgi:hypothetical protein